MGFNNGSGRPGGSYTSVDVFTHPISENNLYLLDSNGVYGPDSLSWQYTATPQSDFFASHISGAHHLENGNTLICDGPQGHYFEIDNQAFTGWEKGDYVMWREDAPHAASNIGIEPRYTLQITGVHER